MRTDIVSKKSKTYEQRVMAKLRYPQFTKQTFVPSFLICKHLFQIYVYAPLFFFFFSFLFLLLLLVFAPWFSSMFFFAVIFLLRDVQIVNAHIYIHICCTCTNASIRIMLPLYIAYFIISLQASNIYLLSQYEYAYNSLA